jgi:hypothetical protein
MFCILFTKESKQKIGSLILKARIGKSLKGHQRKLILKRIGKERMIRNTLAFVPID